MGRLAWSRISVKVVILFVSIIDCGLLLLSLLDSALLISSGGTGISHVEMLLLAWGSFIVGLILIAAQYIVVSYGAGRDYRRVLDGFDVALLFASGIIR